MRSLQVIFSSNSRNKRLQYYVDGRNFFDQPVKNDFRTYDNIRKFAIGQGDAYTAGSLLDYPYFKKLYKLIANCKIAIFN